MLVLIASGFHCNSAHLGAVVCSFVPGAFLVRDISGEVTFVVPKDNPRLIPGIYSQM